MQRLVFVVALAAALPACSTEVIDRSRGGAGGEDASEASVQAASGAGGEGAGGLDTAGAGAGDPGDVTCVAELVFDPSSCDVGCDVVIVGDGAYMCSVTCTSSEDCSPDDTLVCAEFVDGVAACAWSCAGGNACPDGFVCDQDALICFPYG